MKLQYIDGLFHLHFSLNPHVPLLFLDPEQAQQQQTHDLRLEQAITLMLTILAITGPFILIGLCINTVITPTQSRLGAWKEHKMTSSRDVESSERLQQNIEVGVASSRRDVLVNEQKRANRFSSIDVMSNGNMSISSTGFTLPSYFSVDLSTEENYSSDSLEFYGDYECVRRTLDYSYHGASIRHPI